MHYPSIFAIKEQEIEAGTWVAGIARFRYKLRINGKIFKKGKFSILIMSILASASYSPIWDWEATNAIVKAKIGENKSAGKNIYQKKV